MADEENRFSARAARYVRVGTNVGVAARLAGQRLFGLEGDRSRNAAELAAALGGLKGPIMKVAQLLSTIPEALPKERARACPAAVAGPAMGPVRQAAHDGRARPEWASRFASFEPSAAASASLGQVHRATACDGRVLAVAAIPGHAVGGRGRPQPAPRRLSIHARMDPAVDTREILKEISVVLREELDYDLEARHTRLYGMTRRRGAHSRARGAAAAVEQASADHDLARGAAGCSPTRRPRSRSATTSRAPCSGPGGIPSATTA